MCTVTIIPVGSPDLEGEHCFRLVCNRDEQRSRPPATPPQMIRSSGCAALLPIDPPSGGTWIAVNDAAIAFALLNSYPERDAGIGSDGSALCNRRSRGEIVPSLLTCRSLSCAAERMLAIDADVHAPFRLVMTDGRSVLEFSSNSSECGLVAELALDAPVMFTSSGLNDVAARARRRELFDHSFGQAACWRSAQDWFHQHRWPDDPGLSVWMSRREALTVSRTVIQAHARCISLDYYAMSSEKAGESVHLEVSRVSTSNSRAQICTC